MRPSRAVIHGLPDVCLQRGNALAAGQVAEVDGVQLIGREAVVTVARVTRGDRFPRSPTIGRGVGHGPALGSGVVKLPKPIGDDRRLAYVSPDIGDAVGRR